MNIVSSSNYSLAEFTGLFNLGFEDYFVEFTIAEPILAFLCTYSFVDWHRSLVAEVDGEPAGFLLLGSRGWTMRGAAMGIVKLHRNKGIGTALMKKALEDCRSDGFKSMILEVFDANQPAIRVYEKCGFMTKRRLVGYERPLRESPASTDELTEIDPYLFSLQVARHGDPDLPWMCSPEYYAAYPPHLSKAYALKDKAFALVMPKSDEMARISGIVVSKKHRKQGLGRRLLDSLFALYPDRKWEMIPVFPEDMAPGFFLGCGFETIELNQFEMEITFT
jgi:ribosomal protein S18 acetylase RimI-like enzyme